MNTWHPFPGGSSSVAVCPLLAILVLAAPTRAGVDPVRPVSVGLPTVSEAALAPAGLVPGGISDDGRWVVFAASTDNLVENDANGVADVFVFDRTNRTIALVSVNQAGSRSGNGASTSAALSSDGRTVVFQSQASDLVAGDTNAASDVFIRELESGVTRLVSITPDGAVGNGASINPRITPDGRWVVFESTATNLVAEAVSRGSQVYVRDRLRETTLGIAGLAQDYKSTDAASLSGDGSWVAYRGATRLGIRPLFPPSLHVRETSGTPPRSVVTAPEELTFSSVYEVTAPALSFNGRWVGYLLRTGATNEVSDMIWTNEVALYDASSGQTVVIQRSPHALPQGTGLDRLTPAVSSDGRFLTYCLPQLVPGTTNVVVQLFFWDALLQGPAPRMITAAADGSGPANGDSVDPQMSSDGRQVVFVSTATDLVAGVDTPGRRLYRWDRETGKIEVIPTAGAPSFPPVAALSANGAYALAGAIQGTTGALVLQVLETASGKLTSETMEPAFSASSTPRRGLRFGPTGISSDGRWVTVVSSGDDPQQDFYQVSVIDTSIDSRQVVSVNAQGVLANGNCGLPSLSADGRWVVFASAADNLVEGDTNGRPDVFLADRQNPTLRRITEGLPVVAIGGALMAPVTISPDGRYVVFVWRDSPGAQGETGVRLWDRETGETVAVATGGLWALPRFSTDGHRLLLQLGAPGSLFSEVRVLDVPTWLGAGATRVELWAEVQVFGAGMSANGRRVFAAKRTGSRQYGLSVVEIGTVDPVLAVSWSVVSMLDLNADGSRVLWYGPDVDGRGAGQAWVADVATTNVQLASVATDGISLANQNAWLPTISADGRYVAFASRADNLVASDANGQKDVFLRDLKGATLLVSRTPAGAPASGHSTQPRFSPDSRTLFFLSHASDLTAGDFNEASDLFLVKILSDGNGPLLVLQRNLSTGQVQLLWNGTPGKSYRLDSREDLDTGSWEPAPGIVTEPFAVELDPVAARRFYRVVELP